jgi:hypothetical protein
MDPDKRPVLDYFNPTSEKKGIGVVGLLILIYLAWMVFGSLIH